MKTIVQFQKSFKTMAGALWSLNQIAPETKISYLTYISWLRGGKISAAYKPVLFLKGIRTK